MVAVRGPRTWAQYEIKLYYKMPSRSGRTPTERIEADGSDGDARMRQLIMELTRAQSAAALPAPAMPTLAKAGGTHDRQSSLRAAQRAVTRATNKGGYSPVTLVGRCRVSPGTRVY